MKSAFLVMLFALFSAQPTLAEDKTPMGTDEGMAPDSVDFDELTEQLSKQYPSKYRGDVPYSDAVTYAGTGTWRDAMGYTGTYQVSTMMQNGFFATRYVANGTDVSAWTRWVFETYNTFGVYAIYSNGAYERIGAGSCDTVSCTYRARYIDYFAERLSLFNGHLIRDGKRVTANGNTIVWHESLTPVSNF